MPTILVKCVNRHNRTFIFHYRQTYIAQIGTVVLNGFLIWAILTTSLPLVASILLITLSFSLLKHLNLNDHRYPASVKCFQSLKRIDRQLPEIGFQLIMTDNRVLRLMKCQFERSEYKYLNTVLDEGVNNVSVCIVSQDEK